MSKSINHLATADGLFFGKGALDQRKTAKIVDDALAGFDDGLAAAPSVDDKMLAGLRAAKERGMSAPRPQGGN